MDDACAVCAEPLEWVAYGACGHRDVCSTCVARLRFVLRDQRCCICMTPCPAVFVTKAMGDRTRVIDFSALPSAAGEGNAGEYWHHEGTQTWFDDADHYRLIRALCRLSCSVCDGNGNKEERAGKASKLKGSKAKRKNKLRSVDQLKDHLFNRHCLYMCDLCLDGRKIFIREQKLYTMSQLNQHIKNGDSEVDGSEVERHGFRGHPMCEFCKSPFYGDNELYTHVTREHFSCHICQRQHSGQDYFRNYDDLEMHFRRDHFLCRDKGCLEKKFIVFQSEQELKRHNAVEHGKHMLDAVNNSSSFMQNGITAVGHGLGSQAGSVAASLRSLRISPVLQDAFPSLSEQSRKIPALRQSSRTAARVGDDPFPPLSGTSSRNVALQWQGLRTLTESNHATGLRQHSNGTEKMHQTVQHRSLENTGLIPSGSTTWPMHARSSAISESLSEASFSRASAGNERQETLVNRQISGLEDIRAANKSLVEKMRAALGKDHDMYNAFKEISGEYRQGVIGAAEYLSYAKQFGLSHLVLEMARLLPDAQKQKELADAYYANLRLTSLQENGGGGTANSKQGNHDLKGKGKWEIADALDTTSAAKDSVEGKVLNTAIKLQSKYTPQEGCCGVQPLNGAWQTRGRQRLVSSNVKK